MKTRWHVVSVLVPSALLLACSGGDDALPPDAHLAWLEQRAEQVRELQFLEPVEWRRLSQQDYLEAVAAGVAKIDSPPRKSCRPSPIRTRCVSGFLHSAEAR